MDSPTITSPKDGALLEADSPSTPLTVTGTSTPSSDSLDPPLTVYLYDGPGQAASTVPDRATGDWELTLTLSRGEHDLSACLTDSLTATSPWSTPPVHVTVAQPPVPPDAPAEVTSALTTDQ